jgi:hypothetical protein
LPLAQFLKFETIFEKFAETPLILLVSLIVAEFRVESWRLDAYIFWMEKTVALTVVIAFVALAAAYILWALRRPAKRK